MSAVAHGVVRRCFYPGASGVYLLVEAVVWAPRQVLPVVVTFAVPQATWAPPPGAAVTLPYPPGMLAPETWWVHCQARAGEQDEWRRFLLGAVVSATAAEATGNADYIAQEAWRDSYVTAFA